MKTMIVLFLICFMTIHVKLNPKFHIHPYWLQNWLTWLHVISSNLNSQLPQGDWTSRNCCCSFWTNFSLFRFIFRNLSHFCDHQPPKEEKDEVPLKHLLLWLPQSVSISHSFNSPSHSARQCANNPHWLLFTLVSISSRSTSNVKTSHPQVLFQKAVATHSPRVFY